MYRRERMNYRNDITTRSVGQERRRIARKAFPFLLALASIALAVYLVGTWLIDVSAARTGRSPVDEAEVVVRYDACVRTDRSQRQLLACVDELGNPFDNPGAIDVAAGSLINTRSPRG